MMIIINALIRKLAIVDYYYNALALLQNPFPPYTYAKYWLSSSRLFTDKNIISKIIIHDF